MSKVNLIESQFDLAHNFEAAVLCSYGLDLHFLENYLMALRGLGGCDTITIFVDASAYESIGPGSYTPRYLNRRYLVTPIRTVGVFHTKLYILASPKRVLLTIGSANLTREGVAGNLELLTTVEVTEQNNEHAALLGDALDYIRRLAQMSGSKQAIEQANIVEQVCMGLAVHKGGSNAVRLVHNLDNPILDTILDQAADRLVTKVLILSPFFDSALAPLVTLHERLPQCPVEFFVQQKKSNFPLAHLGLLDANFSINLYRDFDRYLHGKGIILERETDALVYTGSANFTRSALMSTARHGNYEIGLLGNVPKAVAQELLYPLGNKPVAVNSASDVEVNNSIEPQPARFLNQIEYLTEAVLEKSGAIRYEIKQGLSPNEFSPKRYRLSDFSGDMVEGLCEKEQVIHIDAKTRHKLQGPFGLQLIGVNGQGNSVESNRVWVIALEERSGNFMTRAIRRVTQDPAQLIQILKELAANNDDREMMLFLAQFDIPLELILPTGAFGRPRSLKSKGNLVGTLPFHRSEFFSSSMIRAFDDCIHRLVTKMRKHLKNPRINGTGNFILLYTSVVSLLLHLNEWALKRYEDKLLISPDDWRSIRDCYDMLVRHTTETWDIVWSRDGYRNTINALLGMKRGDEEVEEPFLFEDMLLTNFDNLSSQYIEALEAPLHAFNELHSRLKVSTPKGLVQPKIFDTAHEFLQPRTREEIWTNRLHLTRQQFGIAIHI